MHAQSHLKAQNHKTALYGQAWSKSEKPSFPKLKAFDPRPVTPTNHTHTPNISILKQTLKESKEKATKSHGNGTNKRTDYPALPPTL